MNLNRTKLTYVILGLILLFSFVTRIYRVWIPAEYYFDEVYHAVTAKLYARNDPSGYEWWHDEPEPGTAVEWLHPPIAKLTQALGIILIGENSLGWRISSVVFGVGVVMATFLVANKLSKSRKVALLSAILLSLDGLVFVQSRIAMNDIHVTFFILMSVFFYSKWKDSQEKQLNLVLSGVFTGIAIATKWSGVFLLGIFIIDQLLTWMPRMISRKKFPSFALLSNLFINFIFLPVLIYVLSFSQFFLQGHSWKQFEGLHSQIWHYQTSLEATHPRQSSPIEWVLDLKPVWMYVNYDSGDKVGNIYNLGNPLIFFGGLIGILGIVYTIIRTKNRNYILLVLAYLIVWLPWMFSPRIMFFYHYLPAVPFLTIILSIFLMSMINAKSRLIKYLAYLFLFACAIWFFLFYPYLTGLPVSKEFVSKVYYILPGWK
ncbi:phospholipid carrier-dependent glycosyltransferase [Candidatus Dojkabacteria bacterium]|nr:phospholipid carrier-dependent glycosyltransferase [Candidatus Dojkabacteria bacterium]